MMFREEHCADCCFSFVVVAVAVERVTSTIPSAVIVNIVIAVAVPPIYCH